MIPQATITHWRNVAPWPQDAQVEQDLILSRALVEIFQEPALVEALAVRGGTALYKLYIGKPDRYSEDIDLVQVKAGGIGPVLDAIRARLDPILGKPRRENNPDNVTLRYRMESEIPPVVPLRLKVEINTREHFTVFGAKSRPFSVESPWFEGTAQVKTYSLEELLGTKLRALYQRRKGRDLYDIWMALGTETVSRPDVVKAFLRYTRSLRKKITGSLFEKNLRGKVSSRQFNEDLRPLLAPTVRYSAEQAARLVERELLALL